MFFCSNSLIQYFTLLSNLVMMKQRTFSYFKFLLSNFHYSLCHVCINNFIIRWIKYTYNSNININILQRTYWDSRTDHGYYVILQIIKSQCKSIDKFHFKIFYKKKNSFITRPIVLVKSGVVFHNWPTTL